MDAHSSGDTASSTGGALPLYRSASESSDDEIVEEQDETHYGIEWEFVTDGGPQTGSHTPESRGSEARWL